MTTTVKLKNSVITTNAPSSLQQGEVAINITDKKVWVGNAATTPIPLLGDTTIAFSAGSAAAPSITFTGDTNTGIFSPAADTIAFTEGGVESMRIDSLGRLGIGTVNPTVSLDIVKEQAIIRATSSTGTNTSYLAANNTGGFLYLGRENNLGDTFGLGGYSSVIVSTGAYPLITSVNGAERMRIAPNGNVGIGTDTPTVRLEFSSTAAASYARSFWNANNTEAGEVARGGYLIGTKNFAGTAVNWGMTGYTDTLNVTFDAGLYFSTVNEATAIERLRITSDGYVGIGTSQPNHLLIVASANEAGNTIIGTYNTNAGSTALQFLLYHNLANVVLGNFRDGNLTFTTNNTAQATITSTGLFQFNSGYGSVGTAYGCRSWVRFNGTGTVAINGSGNVSSITDNGTGDYTINFTTSMPDGNFTVTGAAKKDNNATAASNNITFAPNTFATGSVRVLAIEANLGVGIDCAVVTAAVFR